MCGVQGRSRISVVEPPKFSPAELAGLIAEAEAWLNEQREIYRPRSAQLDAPQKRELAPFFPKEIIEEFRVLDISRSEESIPYPPFYERVRAGGFRLVPDAAHVTAVPFIDVAVFNRPPTLRTLFHNMVHTAQYSIVGVRKVMFGYFSVLNDSGVWIVAPAEEQAYQLDARYTKNPSEFFSVAAEIKEWVQIGKYDGPGKDHP
jgi:hypothetical protein